MYKMWHLLIGLMVPLLVFSQDVPLPEHPRPDFERPNWLNLNGTWSFAFDSLDEGIEQNWYDGFHDFSERITVPFPWGSKLSGLADRADIGWYQRNITVDDSWRGKRIFLTIGAADWKTSVWLDGKLMGSHEGGYVPFSFELTDYIQYNTAHNLIIRVDDKRRAFTLYGKQGYGNARGIWQTIYLEARGQAYLDALHFKPDIDRSVADFTAYLPMPAPDSLNLEIQIKTPDGIITNTYQIPRGQYKYSAGISIPDAQLWSLEDPYLYEVEAHLADDLLYTYFGMRKISVVDLPQTNYRYVALNNRPIYLQMALDQSYNPEGFYTFPDDQFLIDEINRSKSIGLNGIRTHIKVEVPRKLYWADKLGLLVMEDLPNSWGEPDKFMQAESEYTLREMIKRDFNHPSIFSWCDFNETWGLKTKVTKGGEEKQVYLPTTQSWVASMYYLTKSLDPTRLVEDNSICCGAGHTETDLNSWHAYLPGWAWETHLQEMSDNIYPGSPYDFEDGYLQGNQPNFNSECGNVWGYDGSTGDVDWSYDYHRMINSFRKYPKIAGWLYTEHHDVINEWNGYWRFDRTEKETGLGALVPGMTLNDLHSVVYLSTGNNITYTIGPGESLKIPLYLSVMTDAIAAGSDLDISYQIHFVDAAGRDEILPGDLQAVKCEPWMQLELDSLELTFPNKNGLAIVQLTVKNQEGEILHRNFVAIEIAGAENENILTIPASDITSSQWSNKEWKVLDGLKINGAGQGYFEYNFSIPDHVNWKDVKAPYFLVEMSAKELFVKDRETFDKDQNYMKGSRVAPSSNPNSYPMTDETLFPSTVSIFVEGKKVHQTVLPDDPADHRGILSWHHQLQDRKLREAGSYGYLIKVPLSKSMLRSAQRRGALSVRLQADGQGGLAVYGSKFGRYPVDPSIVLY